ncbi:MAG TPA: DNA-formamidopyrimidine glycosylase [Candidatus Krumholzibacteria bacterium]|nr:DNA-formamidopyrimidine glycosylase [Candidatus Krumholzibacteria bacterium]
MPELPEVETTVRLLRRELVGRRFLRVSLKWPRQCPTPEDLRTELPGREVTALSRRGKFIVVHLDPADRTLLVHLRMSGQLSVQPESAPFDPHAHTVFSLDDGLELRFSDTRKFGRVYLLRDPEDVFAQLGPEPLDSAFCPKWMRERFRTRKRAIKTLLLEQSVVAGLGNIYADESLFRAQIDPRRPASSLNSREVRALHRAIRAVLEEAIEHQGTSFDWVYSGGEMQSRLKVYGRKEQPCSRCATPIQRIVVGQRGTHLCPRCQR